jgi:hypothetical protein
MKLAFIKMKLTRIIPIMLALVLGIITHSYADSGYGISGSVALNSAPSISGKVVDSATNVGIENVQLTLTTEDGFSISTSSNAAGNYIFEIVPPPEFIVSVNANYYQEEVLTLNANSSCIIQNFKLDSSTNCIQITPSMKICAKTIVENPLNYYELSGKVNINGILYFDGTILVDKRPNLYHPEISGSGGFYASEIQGVNVQLKVSSEPFRYYAEGSTLTPKNFTDITPGANKVGGFHVKLGQLVLGAGIIECRVIADMPFPFDKILESLQKSYPETFDFVKQVSFSDFYSKTEGRNIAGSISDLVCNFGSWSLENGSLYFDENDHLFGGGFKIKIPGNLQ